jgi:signal transduction histidine kinase/CheY-like chemotaxis protein
MLLAALLPVTLVSMLLVATFLIARSDDMEDAYQQRVRLVARQLASASEYGLFSGNESQLQSVVDNAMRELDVSAALVVDPLNHVVAGAGASDHLLDSPYSVLEEQSFDAGKRLDTLSEPVFSFALALDDLYQQPNLGVIAPSRQLGQVRVAFSRQSLDQRRSEMIWLGGFLGLLGLMFGVLLAAQLSRMAIRPIMRLAQLIDQIGQGDFSVVSQLQGTASATDPLRSLQDNVTEMSRRLASAQQELEQRVIEATQALREKKDEAEQANKAKSRFLAAASHDLRQPTHALGMFVSRLTQLSHDPETQAVVDNLEISVRAMQNLLDGLLDISRLEAQAVQVALKPFAVSSLMQQLQQDLMPLARGKNLQLRLHPCQYWVMSDAVLLYRVLLNLVTNALRYTERGGVLVACRPVESGRKLSIQVWDTGIGIAPEFQDEVFKEFFQVSNAARDRDKGMGLGLSIVKRTSALLGHPLSLTSKLGSGTRVTLSLPLVAPVDGALGGLVAEPDLNDELQGACVLVIEDDALVRSALVGLLTAWGIKVFEASALSGALAIVANGVQPDLLISDYRLQAGDNGIEAVTQLRAALHQSLPAFLMSGDTDPELIAQAQAQGLTLLHKPVRPAKLRSLLRRLLKPQTLGDALR